MSDVDRAVDTAHRILGGVGRRGVPIGPLTTYKVGGSAALFARVDSMAELELVAQAVRESGLPVLVIGRGSNVLVADRGFPGIAVQLGDLAGTVGIPDADGEPVVRAGASVALPVLARRTAAAGWRGFEWAVGVPGSIGGAVRMNAGGHGSDMARSLVGCRVFSIAGGSSSWRSVEAIGLRFRGSDLTDDDVVLDAELRLERGDATLAQAEIDEIVKWRRENQPGGQNAGSVFVNPVPGEIAAGQLIDRLGLRGLRIGTAEVSRKHANFIQADESGRADDVFSLMCRVRDLVEAEFGYRLRSEVRLVGFTGDPL